MAEEQFFFIVFQSWKVIAQSTGDLLGAGITSTVECELLPYLIIATICHMDLIKNSETTL